VLHTPREARTAMVYVLQNWRKHVRGASGIDGCSSGPWFESWNGRRRRVPLTRQCERAPGSHPGAGSRRAAENSPPKRDRHSRTNVKDPRKRPARLWPFQDRIAATHRATHAPRAGAAASITEMIAPGPREPAIFSRP
jgi:hypothetical protein